MRFAAYRCSSRTSRLIPSVTFGPHAIEDRTHVHDIHATNLRCLGIDHQHLTYPYQGRDFRLTDVAGSLDLWKRLTA